MHLRINTLILIFILGLLSLAMVQGFGNTGATPIHSLHKEKEKEKEEDIGGDDGMMKNKNRKLMMIIEPEAVLDYDYAGPNSRHDPRGGGGGKRPGNAAGGRYP
ncbi:hypothetical protein M9H77_26432 [Catharanthus roseus]|uniref:Uncharacterized protein n=1 Tax=Catharanthus roseus TaxID=4058 RepID=A0ACC0AA06_CATRO|nr:hypothetical protein M9H77_26432 [Catharanthus roseus]